MTDETLVRIKKKREEKGLSQENMAEALKISQSNYAKIESGFIQLKVSQLQDIATVLETHINYFLTQENTARISDEVLSELMAYGDAEDFSDRPLNSVLEDRIRYILKQNKLLTKKLIEEKQRNKSNQ